MTKVKLLIKTEILGIPHKKGDIVEVGGVYADKLVDNKVATFDLEVDPVPTVIKNEINDVKPSE